MKRITKPQLKSRKMGSKQPMTNSKLASEFRSHLMPICWINSHTDTAPRPETLTIEELAKRFSVPQTNRGRLTQAEYHALDKQVPAEAKLRKDEKNGTAFIASTFTEPNVRTAKFVAEIHGFILDFDGAKDGVPGVTRAEFEIELATFGYLAHTSYSHLPNDERWRVVVPYSTPCRVDQHAAVYAYFYALFQGRLDPRSETTQQLWYTPACPRDAAEQFQFILHDGPLFDPYAVAPLAESVPKAKISTAATCASQSTAVAASHPLPAAERMRIESAINFINADDRKPWVDVGMALKHHYGDAAKPIWDAWSKTSPKYEVDIAESTWDSFHPQVQGGVTLGTVYHLAQTAGWSSQLVTQPVSPASGPLLPLFDINDARVDRFMRNPAPKREWLLRNTLPFKKVGMLVAPGGTGKSFFTIQAAVAIATKTRLADLWEVDDPGATLILCAEEDKDDLHHRLRDVVAATVGFRPAMEQLIEQRVFIKSMLTENNLMTDVTTTKKVEQTDYVDRLILTAKQIPDLRLIVIDPASRFQGGDELSARDATRFIEALECLRSATGTTVLLVHHATKASMKDEDVNQAAARGSSALTDGARWQMNLGTLNKNQAKTWKIDDKDRHQYVLATITKNNGAPPQPTVLLQRGPGGVLNALATPATIQSPEERIVSLLLTEAAAGRSYSLNGFDQKFSGTTGVLGLSSGALRKLIIEGIKQKVLAKRTTKPIGHLEVIAE